MLAKLKGKVKHLIHSVRTWKRDNVRIKLLPIKGPFKMLKMHYWKVFASFIIILIPVSLFFFSVLEKKRDGTAEAVIYLNSVFNLKKAVIWSNNPEFCLKLKMHCYSGENFPEYTEFDFFVFFQNQSEETILNDKPFAELKSFPGVKIQTKNFRDTVTKAVIISQENIPSEQLPSPAEFTFAIIGDSQRWSQKHNKEHEKFHLILEKIKGFQPDFLLAMGDLTPDYDCTEPSQCRPYFEQWRDEVRSYVPVIYPAFGNHDEDNKARYFWNEVFSLPDNGPAAVGGTAFSFDFKNSHFVFLDSEKSGQQIGGSEQLEWLDKDLKDTTRRNLFAISHAPNFPKPKLKQTDQWKILFANQVFAQFSGDTHVFCRRTLNAPELGLEGKQINHFIIGNSGSMVHKIPPECEDSYRGLNFAIVKIRGDEITVSVYKTNGSLISEFNAQNENYFPLHKQSE